MVVLILSWRFFAVLSPEVHSFFMKQGIECISDPEKPTFTESGIPTNHPRLLVDPNYPLIADNRFFFSGPRFERTAKDECHVSKRYYLGRSLEFLDYLIHYFPLGTMF